MITIDVRDTIAKNIQVWLNGIEVTHLAFWAQLPNQPGIEAEGSVDMYIIGKDGHFTLDDNRELNIVHKNGRVRWEYQEPL